MDLNVETVDNSTDNSTNGGNGGGGTNPCASYTPPDSNEVRIGTFDGTNCTYSASFVGKTNPMLVDLTIPFISGVHLFQDSLFIGQDVTSGAPAGGEGPTLTIAAGSRLAFSNFRRLRADQPRLADYRQRLGLSAYHLHRVR